jgi:MFS family permease
MLMGVLIVFGGGSALAAWSGTPDRLIGAMAIMGVGAAALMPSTLSILTNVLTAEREQASSIGIWSATAGLGVAIGPMLGGFLLVHFLWGSVFLINVPVALIGLVVSAFLVLRREPELLEVRCQDKQSDNGGERRCCTLRIPVADRPLVPPAPQKANKKGALR